MRASCPRSPPDLPPRATPSIVPPVKQILPSLAILALTASGAFAQAKPGGAVIPVRPSPSGAQAKLEPGQFEWHPERSPDGPLLMVCSIDDQMLYANKAIR